MASCWVLSGLVLLAVAFMASAVSFVAPYWYSIRTDHTGLWAHCPGLSDKCKWFFENDFSWEKDQEVWWLLCQGVFGLGMFILLFIFPFQYSVWWFVCQGLFGLGVLILLFIFLIACINLCCGCCKGTMAVTHSVAGCLIFSALLIAVSLILCGVKVNKERSIKVIGSDGDSRLLWGFWVGAGGAGTALLAALFYMCEGCRGHSHDGYTRGEVV